MPIALPPLILLAAGKSQRNLSPNGDPKGLFPFGDRTWFEHQLTVYAEAGGTHATVVLGHHAERFLERCAWLQTKSVYEGISVHVVHNPDPERGPFSSLQLALGETSAFVLPIDVPAPRPPVWHLLAEPRPGCEVAQPVHQDRAGHPVWISARFARTLVDKPATSRLDAEIQSLPVEARARVPVDDSRVLLNLNTPEAWAAFAPRKT